MAYNEKLAKRIRTELSGIPFVEKKMFGGVGYLLNGRPMKGWLMVEPQGYQSSQQLSAWVKEGVEFALTLPPK